MYIILFSLFLEFEILQIASSIFKFLLLCQKACLFVCFFNFVSELSISHGPRGQLVSPLGTSSQWGKICVPTDCHSHTGWDGRCRHAYKHSIKTWYRTVERSPPKSKLHLMKCVGFNSEAQLLLTLRGTVLRGVVGECLQKSLQCHANYWQPASDQNSHI